MPQAEHHRRNQETRKPIRVEKREGIVFVPLSSAGKHNESKAPSYQMSQAMAYSKRSTTRRGDRRNDSRWHIFVPPHFVYLKTSLPHYGTEIKRKIIEGCPSIFCNELGTAGRKAFPNVVGRRTRRPRQSGGGGNRTRRLGNRPGSRRTELEKQEQQRGKHLPQARSRSLLQAHGLVGALLGEDLVPGFRPALITDGGA
jgi:hypothetical protein